MHVKQQAKYTNPHMLHMAIRSTHACSQSHTEAGDTAVLQSTLMQLLKHNAFASAVADGLHGLWVW